MRKSVLLSTLFFLLGCLASASMQNEDFADFLQRWKECSSRFINADPSLWKASSSHSADATIFGAFGGHEKGWDAVGPRYDWASAQFKPPANTITIEYLSSGSSGDLGFSVAIEHQTTQLGSQAQPVEHSLRVTQIFRKEGGVWKLLHRHADGLTDKKAPQ